MKLCTQALVFDAYGTLFDVHAVIALCDRKFPRGGRNFPRARSESICECTSLPGTTSHSCGAAVTFSSGSLL